MSTDNEFMLPTGASLEILRFSVFERLFFGGTVAARAQELRAAGVEETRATARACRTVAAAARKTEPLVLECFHAWRGDCFPSELETLVPQGPERFSTLARHVGGLTWMHRPKERAVEPTKEGIHVSNLLGLMRCLLRVMPTGGERELMKLLIDGRRQVLEDEGLEVEEALLESARKEFSWAIHAVAGERLLGEGSGKANPTVRARLDLLEEPLRKEIVNRVGSSE